MPKILGVGAHAHVTSDQKLTLVTVVTPNAVTSCHHGRIAAVVTQDE